MNIAISFFLLIAGLVCGIYAYKNTLLKIYIPKIFHYIVYVLLFFLGSKLGSSPQFIANTLTLGTYAFVISVCCIIGACIAAYIVYKFLFTS